MGNKNMYWKIIIFFVWGFIILGMKSVVAQDKMRGPPIKKFNHYTEKYGEGTNTFLNFYQKRISPVKGGNTCPMHPSCSQYAKIAFHSLPCYTAYIKTCERLLRCGHELDLYPILYINGGRRWYDPVVYRKEEHDVKNNQTNL